MKKIISNRLSLGFFLVFCFAYAVGFNLEILSDIQTKGVEAMERKPKGIFINLVNFPSLKPGKETEFLEWFRWSNEVYAKHRGFISRTLLRSTEGKPLYAAIVEHDSKETFMAMHLSKDREEAFKRVEPLMEGKPTPHFFETVISYRK